jgi:hypothetical protein
MKPEIEAVLKRMVADGELSEGDKSLLSSEIAMALELFSLIARFVPEAYHKDLTPVHWPTMYSKTLRLFVQPGKEKDCSHEFIALGPVVDGITNHLSYSILKQCKLCKTITLEPEEALEYAEFIEAKKHKKHVFLDDEYWYD